MKVSTSSDPDTGLIVITVSDDRGTPLGSRVVSAEAAERVGFLFLGAAAAARARGERTESVDLDEVATSDPT